MATFDDELLTAARLLIRRKTGQRGKLPSARIRRSISTTYYALFHFLLEEAGKLVVGSTNDVRVRRHQLSRTISHKAVKSALDRVRGTSVDALYADFFRYRGAQSTPVPPRFAQEMARVFSDAQSKRHDADYNLQEPLSARDASLLNRRVKRTIKLWRGAKTHQDKDFKKAICLLIFVKGQIRSDN